MADPSSNRVRPPSPTGGAYRGTDSFQQQQQAPTYQSPQQPPTYTQAPTTSGPPAGYLAQALGVGAPPGPPPPIPPPAPAQQQSFGPGPAQNYTSTAQGGPPSYPPAAGYATQQGYTTQQVPAGVPGGGYPSQYVSGAGGGVPGGYPTQYVSGAAGPQFLRGGLQNQLNVAPSILSSKSIEPDTKWIHERTKYKTAYIRVPMIREIPKLERKKVVVDAWEKVWETKWIQFQVPVQILEPQKVMVLETQYEDQVTEEEREIKVPHRVMETKTIMVPKQRVVMYEEEQSIQVHATEEVVQQIQVPRQSYHTTVVPISAAPAVQYHTVSTPQVTQFQTIPYGSAPAVAPAGGNVSYALVGDVSPTTAATHQRTLHTNVEL